MKQLNLFGDSEPVAQTYKQPRSSSVVELLKSRPEPNPQSPIIVSYGGGVDSTAMLVAMYLKGIRPDLIVFSDTGDEKRETYEFIKLFSKWLKSKNFPPVTRTRYQIDKPRERRKFLAAVNVRYWKTLDLAILEAWSVAYQNVRQIVRYDSLMEECIIFQSLPSKAYGNGQCSAKWKIAPSRKLTKKWLEKRGFDFDIEIRCLIGINAEEPSRLFDKKGKMRPLIERDYGMHLRNEYPLIEWGLTKANEKALIASTGLPVPPKSSCKRCPNMTPSEVLALSPEDYEMGCFIEENAEPFSKIKGLGRSFSWRALKELSPLELAGLDYKQALRKCNCVD